VVACGCHDTLGGMCRRTKCRACGKPTWAGCGAHVEQVLGDVPRSERCRCREDGPPPRTQQFKTTAKAKPADAAPAPTGTLGRVKEWLKR